MKIARWEAYSEEGKEISPKSKRKNWDVAGLKKHVEHLTKLLGVQV